MKITRGSNRYKGIFMQYISGKTCGSRNMKT